MFILFILGLIIGGFAIIFAFQNIVPITVMFFGWSFHSSLALVLGLAVLLGAIIGMLLTIPEAIRNSFIFSGMKRQNAELKDRLELEKQKKLELLQKQKEDLARVAEVKLTEKKFSQL